MSEAVVEPALLGIGKHLVGLRRFLEARLRHRIRVAVGMQLKSQLAVGALELGGIGVAANP